MKNCLLVIASMFVAVNSFAAWETLESSLGYRYEVYTPKTIAEKPGMLVMLHGCMQNPQQMMKQTKFVAEADRKGFYLYVPQQSNQSNPWGCWNWGTADNQSRNVSGDSAYILSNMEKVILDKKVDRSQVYVVGFSSGAGLASNLMSCFPELFKGALIHSGLEFRAALGAQESFQVMKSGPNRPVEQTADLAYNCMLKHDAMIPIFSVHGSSDTTVAPINFQRLTKQFELVNQKIAVAMGGQGKVEEKESQISGSGLPTKMVDIYVDGKLIQKSFLVQGMNHAWSGGDRTVQFSEPRGPAISTIFADYFFPANVK